MVKFTSSLLVAVLVAAPVFASANWDELDARDISEQNIFGRELTETETLFARELEGLFARVSEDLATREIEVQDLAERSKIGRFFSHAFHAIKNVVGKVASVVMKREDGEEVFARDDISEQNIFGRELTETEAVFARELDELLVRVSEDLATREVEVQDLAERSKIGRFFSHAFHAIKNVVGKVASVVMKREDGEEEVFARGAGDLESRELDQLFERYVEEIEERTPGFFNFMTRGMESVKHISREFNDLSERDLVDEEDLFQRDLDLDLDLAERDFEEFYEREFEDQYLLERSFDELEEREIDELD
jgi:hypothetical protein